MPHASGRAPHVWRGLALLKMMMTENLKTTRPANAGRAPLISRPFRLERSAGPDRGGGWARRRTLPSDEPLLLQVLAWPHRDGPDLSPPPWNPLSSTAHGTASCALLLRTDVKHCERTRSERVGGLLVHVREGGRAHLILRLVLLSPLLPRMKVSPYLALSWPLTYSSVCSIAMFMYPSRHASTPVSSHARRMRRQNYLSLRRSIMREAGTHPDNRRQS